ncbi:protein kinase [Myxococcus stipitatus]|uniref:serine/threonine-protein kinase n=1 Tax=Myxococcus stipitatus TaxID=83455 RepID=UPI001F408BDD|nr:serine/threonine-protein kinase [Myxococcus stipitatus]MCE9668400.1 protein kinase [Myxococcus stipitatus]
MSEQDEVELRHVLAEGLVSREEAAALREDAARLGRRPLELLRERGRLSEDTYASALRVLRPVEAVPAGASSPEAARDLPGAWGDVTGAVLPRVPATGPARVDSGAPEREGAHRATGVAPSPSPDPGPVAAVEPVPAFPVPGWERYQPVRFLGQGGMGRVFLAWDPGLRRHVALKFVRGDEPELARRFVAEARAQARITHPRVCEVYEVGEVQGRVYIAMRHVDGVSLGALADSLSLEQKAMLIREAAEGVHAAHRAGLVHRDIKPVNILVERSADGALSPFVMDFGLARDWKEGVTATGTVLGTPHYMSPEQARGEVARLDRRADVYALGATLYALLTGRPPIPGENALEVLGNIATVEPRPPRSLERDIPPDLEAITLKCLEKERSARYGSARELAEDLSRFLDGAPVLARTGWGYRARKWVRRRRGPVLAATVGLLVVGLAVGQAVHARREVVAREALARGFTEQVERIDAQARISALAPLHDTRGDRESMRGRMRAIEDAMRGAGPTAEGPGHFALGRGFLALDDPDSARRHLEAAWEAGYQEPRVAHALALALGQLYQRARLEAERLQEAAARAARLAEVDRLYREPARDFLRRSAGAEGAAPEYVAALLAFWEDRPDEARAQLAALEARLRWFHEAPQLLGDILLARAVRRWNTGDREGARADLQESAAAYSRALDIGRNVPGLYKALARLEGWALLMSLYSQGEVAEHHARGVEAVSRALVAAPDDAEAHELEAGLHRRFAEHESRRGGDVSTLTAKALLAARRAVELAPGSTTGLHELALANWQEARMRQEKGQDPRPSLLEAAAAFERIPVSARDYSVQADLGQVFRVWADYEDGVGGDSRAYRERAIASHERAVQLDARRPEAWINLGTELLARASHPQAANPGEDLDQAMAALERAQSINPSHVVPWFYAGEVQLAKAARLRDSGADVGPALERALTLYRKGLSINAELPPLHNGLGTALFEQAKVAWERGGDPEPLLDEARKAFEAAVALAPAQGYGQNNLGEVHAWRAAVLLKEGRSPEAAVRAARAALEKAVTLVPDLPQPWLNLGLALHVEAIWAIRREGTAGVLLDMSYRNLSHARSLNPKLAGVWHSLGEASMVEVVEEPGPDAGGFEEAERAFQKAIELEPAQPEHRVAFSLACLQSARRLGAGDAASRLTRGLALVDEALVLRPAWPRAQALRAATLLTLAELPGRPESTPEARREARESLARAIQENRHLAHEWSPFLAEPRPGAWSATRAP